MSNEQLTQTLTNYLNIGERDGLFSGAQCVVQQKSVLSNVCCGYTRFYDTRLDPYTPRKPIDNDTLFDVASLTKPLVTASLVMHAVDEGRLRLDQKLVGLSNLPLPSWLLGSTIAEFLTHSTPLPAWHDFHGKAINMQARSFLRRRVLTEIQRLDPRPDADTKACYSDLGYIVLGSVLEDIYGEQLDVLFRKYITDPLGLSDSMMFTPLEKVARNRCASTKRYFGFPLTGHPDDDNCRALLHVAGHAGLFATATAVTDFVAALLDGSFPAKKSTINLFLTARYPKTTYALGWDRPTGENSLSGRKPGSPVVGHLGFTGCSVWFDLKTRRIVTLLTNRQNINNDPESIADLRRNVYRAAWEA